MKPRKIWFDEVVKRLNVEGRGDLLGSFKGEDRLLLVTQNGIIKTIIEAFQGSINFTSEEGEGTTFIVKFPKK